MKKNEIYFHIFIDSLLENLWLISQTKESKLKIEEFSSQSTDIVFYQDLCECLPLDVFTLSYTIKGINILAISQIKYHEQLSKNEAIDLYNCISESVYKTFNNYHSIQDEKIKFGLDFLPFKKKYFLEIDKVSVFYFKAKLENKDFDFFIIISEDDFLRMNGILLPLKRVV